MKDLTIIQKSDVAEKNPAWQEGKALTVVFAVTEDCQLACKYCYVIHKNNHTAMNFDTAKGAVDYLLANSEIYPHPALIVDFIGGEPLMAIDLIDKVVDYLKIRLYELDHRWFGNYRISISTNGLLYSSPKVQRFLDKNKNHLSIGISIDGTREKHDLQRIFPDGRGSYDAVVAQLPLWLSQFPDVGTKVTVSTDDLPYLAESVVHLWDLGLRDVNANVVFEEVWKPGDDDILEQQLKLVSDHLIDTGRYKTHTCSFLNLSVGQPLTREENQNWCGAGRFMVAVDNKGILYPCNRFFPMTMVGDKGRPIGDIHKGIDQNLLRPFKAMDRLSRSNPECQNCEVASGCAWCVGNDFDSIEIDSVYIRATYLCKMHKARARSVKYFKNRLEALDQEVSQR